MWIRGMEHSSSTCDINRKCETAYGLEKVIIEDITTWQKAEKALIEPVPPDRKVSIPTGIDVFLCRMGPTGT
jgi:hypothetical protein